jgi:hypothetical protein
VSVRTTRPGSPARPVLAAALTAAMLLASRPAVPQVVDAPRVLSAIPGEVIFLRLTGSWENDRRGGPTRIVLVRAANEDAMRLFVQWLVHDRRANRFSVFATEEVPEVYDWRISIDDYRVEPEATGSRVVLEASVLSSGARRTYQLTIGQPGEVMFGAR